MPKKTGFPFCSPYGTITVWQKMFLLRSLVMMTVEKKLSFRCH